MIQLDGHHEKMDANQPGGMGGGGSGVGIKNTQINVTPSNNLNNKTIINV